MICDTFASYHIAWAISIAASLGGVVCTLLLEPTSDLFIPGWKVPHARVSGIA